MFWIATTAPLVVSAMLMIIIFNLDNLSFASWNSVNIGIAYTHFKVPLVIASLSFPLGAVIIASHRSAQTLMMAELQSSQNRFANYFLHLDRFKDELSESDFDRCFTSLRAAHDILYPELLRNGSIAIDESIIKYTSDAIRDLNTLASSINASVPTLPATNNSTPITVDSNKLRSQEHRATVISYFSTAGVQSQLSNMYTSILALNQYIHSALKDGNHNPSTLDEEIHVTYRSTLALGLLVGFSGHQEYTFDTQELTDLGYTYDTELIGEIKKANPDICIN